MVANPSEDVADGDGEVCENSPEVGQVHITWMIGETSVSLLITAGFVQLSSL